MGSFIEDLWSSVFTPGPTPTLLVATNVTFGALQVLLLALLVTTYSIHFFVLSFLSGALWWSINWFARELAAFQEAEKKEKQNQQEGEQEGPGRTEQSEKFESAEFVKSDRSSRRRRTPGAIDSAESDTETETWSEGKRSPSASASADAGAAAARSTATATSAAAVAATTLQPPEEAGARKRLSVSGESSSGYVSTDSEWEKVDNGNTA